MEFASSPCVCVGVLLVLLRLPPTVQRHGVRLIVDSSLPNVCCYWLQPPHDPQRISSIDNGWMWSFALLYWVNCNSNISLHLYADDAYLLFIPTNLSELTSNLTPSSKEPSTPDLTFLWKQGAPMRPEIWEQSFRFRPEFSQTFQQNDRMSHGIIVQIRSISRSKAKMLIIAFVSGHSHSRYSLSARLPQKSFNYAQLVQNTAAEDSHKSQRIWTLFSPHCSLFSRDFQFNWFLEI